MSKLKALYLKEIKEHLRQLDNIVEDIELPQMEMTSLRSAARQAEQVASSLNRLIGVVDTEIVRG